MLAQEIIAIGATIIVAIFVILFIYLTAKWSIKKAKEMSKKFEIEEEKK
jgi:TRAP-type C4-dicarboxylate transport system permease small subunit